MPRNPEPTREKILTAANRLFYGEGIGRVSVDAVAEKAGVTKRTLYYHFRSKDDLIAAYLESRDQPNLNQFAKWFAAGGDTLPEKVAAMFEGLGKAARSPRWKGCGFLRTVAELANKPGHPAVKVGAAHKKKFEAWLTDALADTAEPAELARQIVLLMEGAFSTMLIHRESDYIRVAGETAAALVRAREQKGRRRSTAP
ncbi:TetR/AcrR family transcriptional regulator [Dichotomicrobium thermohalophilum]|nr:TetR/AcrR family transcriptional regulator [Dichotomicrobium thermohalophilum]